MPLLPLPPSLPNQVVQDTLGFDTLSPCAAVPEDQIDGAVELTQAEQQQQPNRTEAEGVNDLSLNRIGFEGGDPPRGHGAAVTIAVGLGRNKKGKKAKG
mmetsp:Transcript_32280/g.65951  ORF Transcript_32280/g.65951 Transcript_32280/m.65951 type:complete len:99 (-) Transcript_32280:63-359(-)